jgi:MinD superfamily P-loop ATPase
MAYKIAVASGKGGTGKTTVAANLFRLLSEQNGTRVDLVDCDVEEPNDLIFFPEAKKREQSQVTQEIPVIDPSRCTYCRKCTEYCEFNAILVIPPARFAEVNPSLCHSCGACSVACDADAIWVKDEEIGTISGYDTGSNTGILEGRLKIGSSMQTMVIRSLKQSIPRDSGLVILDAPPGTSCPVVETISDADYIILVTEPTPFGLHDLRLMVDLVRELDSPFGVVINKANLGNRDIYHYLESEKITLLEEIPFSKSYAAGYAGGTLFAEVPGAIEKAYQGLATMITERMEVA